jgi:hypothetical protein
MADAKANSNGLEEVLVDGAEAPSIEQLQKELNKDATNFMDTVVSSRLEG